MTQVRDEMRDMAEEYGKDWINDNVVTDENLDEWKNMTFDSFSSALANANSPCFDPMEDLASDEDFDSMDEIYDIALNSAWEELEKAVEKEYQPDLF